MSETLSSHVHLPLSGARAGTLSAAGVVLAATAAAALGALFFVLPLPMWVALLPALAAVVWWERCVEAMLVLLVATSSWLVIPLKVPGLFSRPRLAMIMIPALTMLTALGMLARLASGRRVRVFSARTDAPALVFLSLALVSAVIAWSYQRPPAMFKQYALALSIYLTCFGAYWVTATLIRNREANSDKLLLWIVIAMLAASLPVAALEFVGWEQAGATVEYGQDIDAPLGGGFLGCYWVMMLSIALGLLLKLRHTLWRLALLPYIAMGVAGLIIPFARAAWVGGAVALATILFRLKKLYLALLLVGCSLLLLYDPVWQKALDLFTDRQIRGTYSRFTLWQGGLDLIKEHPLIGVGPGNYGYFSFTGKGPIYSAHNNYIEVAVESGVFELAAFVAFIAMVWLAIDQLCKRPGPPLRSGVALGALGALAGIAAASVFGDFLLPVRSNNGFVSISGSIYLWIVIGYMVGARDRLEGAST